MLDGPYPLAFAAGLLAAVNPCGFALLPAYVSFLALDGDDAPRSRAVIRALFMTAAMTVGFVAVFGGFGLLAAPVADAVARHLPGVSVGIGLILMVVGGWLLAGRQLPTITPRLGTGPRVTRRFGSMALFGASYAIASLGCTIGPFLAVVVAGFRTDSVAAGIGLFLAYAAGMGTLVGAIALAIALAKVSPARSLRRAGPLIVRTAGALLVVTGAYVAWYAWYEIRVLRGGPVSDPVVEHAARVQAGLAGWLDRVGPTTVTVAFVLLLVATVILIRGRRRTRR